MILRPKFAALILLSLMALVISPSCSEEDDYITADQANHKFHEEIQKSNFCDVSGDCIVFGAECPLDCWYYINKERKASVQQKHDSLIELYENGGTSCSYDCIDPLAATCINQRCTREQ